MTEPEFLTIEDVRQLTGRTGAEAQAKVLADIGVPFRRRGRTIIVSRAHARAWLEGRPIAPSRQPNMSAIR